MKDYPDPHDYFEQRIRQAAEQDSENLSRAGLEPTPILAHALRERAIEQVSEQYQRELLEIRDHNVEQLLQRRDQNIAQVLKRYRRRMNALKRRGHRLRLWLCPLLACLFALLSWYNFTQPGGVPIGICAACGSIAFIAMLLGGMLFDKPLSE